MNAGSTLITLLHSRCNDVNACKHCGFIASCGWIRLMQGRQPAAVIMPERGSQFLHMLRLWVRVSGSRALAPAAGRAPAAAGRAVAIAAAGDT